MIQTLPSFHRVILRNINEHREFPTPLPPMKRIGMVTMGDEYSDADASAGLDASSTYTIPQTPAASIGVAYPQIGAVAAANNLTGGSTSIVNSIIQAATSALGLSPSTKKPAVKTGGMPSWLLPAALGVGALVLMSGRKR